MIDPKYLAGFLDADGHITIIRRPLQPRYRNRNFYLQVALYNTDREVLERISEEYPGYLYSVKETNPKRSTEHRLIWTHEKAASMLRSVLPCLIVKKRQAEVGLAFHAKQRKTGPNGHSTAELVELNQFKLEINQLNKRGPA